jgi:hypothetical protein
LFGTLTAGFGQLVNESRPEKQWVPAGSRSLYDKDFVDLNFPSSLRFGSFIMTCPDIEPDCNMLEATQVQRMAEVMRKIEAIEVDGNEVL